MFNAIEARQLTELCATTYKKELEEILDLIKHAALNGRSSIQIRNYEFGSGKCYTTEDKYPPICQYLLWELRALGFKCKIGCNECQFFVDMYLEISW